jgi:hypothetical protein
MVAIPARIFRLTQTRRAWPMWRVGKEVDPLRPYVAAPSRSREGPREPGIQRDHHVFVIDSGSLSDLTRLACVSV